MERPNRWQIRPIPTGFLILGNWCNVVVFTFQKESKPKMTREKLTREQSSKNSSKVLSVSETIKFNQKIYLLKPTIFACQLGIVTFLSAFFLSPEEIDVWVNDEGSLVQIHATSVSSFSDAISGFIESSYLLFSVALFAGVTALIFHTCHRFRYVLLDQDGFEIGTLFNIYRAVVDEPLIEEAKSLNVRVVKQSSRLPFSSLVGLRRGDKIYLTSSAKPLISEQTRRALMGDGVIQ